MKYLPINKKAKETQFRFTAQLSLHGFEMKVFLDVRVKHTYELLDGRREVHVQGEWVCPCGMQIVLSPFHKKSQLLSLLCFMSFVIMD